MAHVENTTGFFGGFSIMSNTVPYGLLSVYPPSNHIQRRIDRQHANELPISGKDEFARRGLRTVRERDVDQSDRLLRAAPARPRDAGDAYAESRTGALADS